MPTNTEIRSTISKKRKIIIADSFVELLNKKSIDKITIQEISDKANINRSTFYKHFANIFDLLNYVVEATVKDIFPKHFLLEPDSYNIAVAILSVIKNYRKSIKNIIRKTEYVGSVLQEMDKTFVGYMLDELKSLGLENDIRADIIVKSFCGGFIRMIFIWTDFEEISDETILQQSIIIINQLKSNIFGDK